MDQRMIVIVEGADLVGKTTLIDGLTRFYPWPVIKLRWDLSGDPEVETRAMARATTAIFDAVRPDVILDRSYFSWWAYSVPLGHDDSYMPKLICQYKPAELTRLIVLTASAAEIARRFTEKPDLYFSLDVIQAANARFPSLLRLLPKNLKYIQIDTTKNNAQDVLRLARRFLSKPSPTPAAA
jgi:thymidylate kinase